MSKLILSTSTTYDKHFTYKIESEDENLATLAYQTVFGD